MKSPLTLLEIYQFVLTLYFDRTYLDSLPDNVRWNYTGKTIFHKIWNILERPLKFVKQGFIYEYKFRQYLKKEALEGKTWLFITTKNNRDSLKFLLEELDDAVLIGDGFQVDKTDNFQIPFYQSLLSFYKFPALWWQFYKKYGTATVRYTDFIFKVLGVYEVSYRTLKKFQPNKIVVANDHSEKQRAIRLAAKQLNIPVVYIQHASISEFMPPLDFDLALLEGQDAWDKYQAKGKVKGEVKLIGMPKFDDYIPYRNFSTTVNNVGICINTLDSEEYVVTLLNQLQAAFPTITFCFRPHPRDTRQFNLDKSILRSTNKEGVFDFLKRQDLIIAGSSSVHLEAILLNVTSIYYEISPMIEGMQDPYGYVKNGLIPKANSIETLIKVIKKEQHNRQPVIENARYYNELVGTELEGKSSELAGQYIRALK